MGMIYTLICNDGTVYVGDQSKTCVNNGGKKSSSGGTIDWGSGIPKATQTPVPCKDGTTDFSLSSPNARYDNSKVCANNGGVDTEKARQQAQKQYEEALKKQYEEALKQQPQKPRTFIEMNQGYIIIGVVLVAGYFAYKKYKK